METLNYFCFEEDHSICVPDGSKKFNVNCIIDNVATALHIFSPFPTVMTSFFPLKVGSTVPDSTLVQKSKTNSKKFNYNLSIYQLIKIALVGVHFEFGFLFKHAMLFSYFHSFSYKHFTKHFYSGVLHI